MEKLIKPISGFLTLIAGLIFLVIEIVLAMNTGHYGDNAAWITYLGFLLILLVIFCFKGTLIVSPNQSIVCTLFGKYVGSIKENGLLFVNPFYKRVRISLRANNFESSKLKVNDKTGNPIEIAAIIVWQVKDTFKAIFEVSNYDQFVKIQSESAVRHLANTCPYDQWEDKLAEVNLRDGGEKVTALLEAELEDRLSAAGITVIEARISHLAYAAEIAGAMLQRQQASAIVAARFKIVEGAVSMVELALDQLSKRDIVILDDDKKAAMVSNLMVVLCGERAATPVLNTGTLYQ